MLVLLWTETAFLVTSEWAPRESESIDPRREAAPLDAAEPVEIAGPRPPAEPVGPAEPIEVLNHEPERDPLTEPHSSGHGHPRGARGRKPVGVR